MSADGNVMATGSLDRRIHIYRRAPSGFTHLLTLTMPGPVEDLALSDDGAKLAVAIHQETAARVWHLDRLFGASRALTSLARNVRAFQSGSTDLRSAQSRAHGSGTRLYFGIHRAQLRIEIAGWAARTFTRFRHYRRCSHDLTSTFRCAAYLQFRIMWM